MSVDHSRTILVMRHAEKPDDQLDPNLSSAGFARAKRLVSYVPETFGKPGLIIATAVSKHSERPLQTVVPLAFDLSINPKTPFADDEYHKLAEHILKDPEYDVPLCVVCWHHGKIPQLMQALGAPTGHYPTPWDPQVFNLILRATLSKHGGVMVDQVEEPF